MLDMFFVVVVVVVFLVFFRWGVGGFVVVVVFVYKRLRYISFNSLKDIVGSGGEGH